MPRYTFETDPTSDADFERLVRLAAQRFPEVTLEQRLTVGDEDACDLWICRSASETHLQSWARAGQLEVRHVRSVQRGAVVDAARRGEPS